MAAVTKRAFSINIHSLHRYFAIRLFTHLPTGMSIALRISRIGDLVTEALKAIFVVCFWSEKLMN